MELKKYIHGVCSDPGGPIGRSQAAAWRIKFQKPDVRGADSHIGLDGPAGIRHQTSDASGRGRRSSGSKAPGVT